METTRTATEADADGLRRMNAQDDFPIAAENSGHRCRQRRRPAVLGCANSAEHRTGGIGQRLLPQPLLQMPRLSGCPRDSAFLVEPNWGR